MPLKAAALTRKFLYKGTVLPDPNPALEIEKVRDILSATHAELANAAIDGPVTKGCEQTYTFIQSVGTKG
jgi:PRTRC genetic system protein C